MGEIRLRRGGVTWWIDDRQSALADELARLVHDVDRGALPNQKHGRRKELYFVELPQGEHLLKVNRYAGADAWWRRLRGSKARREQRIARAVAARGLPVPLPTAWGERGGARLEACFLLVPRLPDVVDLTACQADPAVTPSSRRAIAAAFGALSRRVHEAGLQQEDFAPNNFLVRASPAPELFVIDFERARLLTGAVPEADRLRALVRLDRRLPGVSAGERWRFLRGYAEGPAQARQLWWQLAALSDRIAERDLARLRRTTTRPGRRFRSVRSAQGSGWALPDAPLEALLEGGGAGGSAGWRRASPDRGRRQARELWATANLLWLRQLGAQPVALLRGQDGCVLWLAGAPGARELAGSAPHPVTARAVQRLLGRLLALGSLDAGLRPSEIALIPHDGGSLRAVLLAPERVHVGRAPPPKLRLAEARRLTRGLMGINP